MKRYAFVLVTILVGFFLIGKGIARHHHEGATECVACTLALNGRRDATAENPETWLSPNGLTQISRNGTDSYQLQQKRESAQKLRSINARPQPVDADQRLVFVSAPGIARSVLVLQSAPRAPPI